jgi:predicted RNase H-like HicB family nuclease
MARAVVDVGPHKQRDPRGIDMKHEFTLEFWEDDGWFVGKLKEVPGVFSQGETLQDLEENIADAYKLMSRDDQAGNRPPARTKGIVLEVA